jgi:predicted nucleic acid-binding protein
MNTKYVIDSSTLISLAKIGKLELLEKVGFQLYSPPEVFTETTEQAILHGSIEGLEIKKLFTQKTIHQQKGKKNTIKGISSTDAKVVQLAESLQAGILANDTTLGRKARIQDLTAMGTPDILLLAKEKNILTEKEFKSNIKELVAKKRLSKKNAVQYLRGD